VNLNMGSIFIIGPKKCLNKDILQKHIFKELKNQIMIIHLILLYDNLNSRNIINTFYLYRNMFLRTFKVI